MKTSKSLVAAMAMATSVLLVIPASASVGSWSVPQPVSVEDAGQGDQDVQVVSFEGRATAVWQRCDQNIDNCIIQSSTSLDGAGWSNAVDVSALVDPSAPRGSAEAPQITVNSNGRIIAVWHRNLGGGVSRVESKTSLDGISWSNTQILSNPTGQALIPQVAVDSSNRAIVVWDDMTGSAVMSRTSLDGGVTWASTMVNLSDSGENITNTINDVTTPQITIGSNGLAAVVWEVNWDVNGDSRRFIQVSTSLNGPGWSPVRNLSAQGSPDGPSPVDPQVAVDSSGRVTVVWEMDDEDDDIDLGIIQSSTGIGGSWSAPVDLSTRSARDAQIVVDSNGRATVVWGSDDGEEENRQIESRSSLNGGTWSPVILLSLPNEEARSARLTVNSSNLVTVVWRGLGSTGHYVIKSRTSLNDAPWSTPLALFASTSPHARSPQVTVDSTGLVTAVWQRGVIQSSFFRQTVAGSTPGTPGTPTATAGNAQVTVQVTAPTTGGTPLSYTVTASPGGASCTITAPATSCTITGLTNGTTYTFSSTGTNGGGTSGVSASSSSVTPTAPPASAPTTAPAASAPTTAPAATLAATGVDVSWLPLAGATAAIAGLAFLALGRGRRT